MGLRFPLKLRPTTDAIADDRTYGFPDWQSYVPRARTVATNTARVLMEEAKRHDRNELPHDLVSDLLMRQVTYTAKSRVTDISPAFFTYGLGRNVHEWLLTHVGREGEGWCHIGMCDGRCYLAIRNPEACEAFKAAWPGVFR